MLVKRAEGIVLYHVVVAKKSYTLPKQKEKSHFPLQILLVLSPLQNPRSELSQVSDNMVFRHPFPE